MVQSSSGALHDYYNKESLWVASNAVTTPFQIWGDDTMINGGDGVRIASDTAHMSQQSILDLLGTGQTAISTQNIRDRFPTTVRGANNQMLPLQQWNDSVRGQANSLFPDLHYYVLRAYPRIGNISIDTSGGWTWQQLPGTAKDVGAGADGSVWVIGANQVGGGYGIYHWNGSGWDNVDGGAVRITVGPDGLPWLVNDAGNIYRRVGSGLGSSWQQLPGLAKDIGAGADGSVWLIGASPVGGGYGIYYWNGTDWTNVPGGALRIAVAPDGLPWLVNDSGNIYQRLGAGTGSSWQQMPGLAKDIGVGAGLDGSPWVIGANQVGGGYGIYHWNGTTWENVPGGAVAIAVAADGSPWVVNDSGNIYHWVPGAMPRAMAAAAAASPAEHTSQAEPVGAVRAVPAVAPSAGPVES